jgi:hypothetical protein
VFPLEGETIAYRKGMKALSAAPTFTKLVLSRAYENTKRVFGNPRRDLTIGIFLAIIGSSYYWYVKGLPVAMEQFATAAVYTFGSLGIIVTIVFLWHLCLAPFELTFEEVVAARSEIVARATPAASLAPPNWAVWKQREAYTILEFSSLLDNSDPGSRAFSSSKEAYIKLLQEQAVQGNLRYISENISNYFGEVSQKESQYANEDRKERGN